MNQIKKLFEQKKVFQLLFMIVLMALFAPPVKAEAATTYTVTYRAGKFGTFDTSQFPGASEVTQYYVKYSGLLAGSPYPDAPDGIQIKITDPTAYFVQTSSNTTWGPKTLSNVADGVKKDCEFTVQYGRLIDSVEYSVKYVDNATGMQISNPEIKWGNNNTTVSANAKSISGYTLVSDTTLSVTLQKTDLAANVIAFRYDGPAGATITNTTNQVVPGGTTTTTDIVDNPIPLQAAVVAGGGGGGAAGDAVVIPDDGVALAANPEEAANGNDNASEEEATTEITDEETPLAVPHINNWKLILTGILAGLFIIIAGISIGVRRSLIKLDAQTENDEKENK